MKFFLRKTLILSLFFLFGTGCLTARASAHNTLQPVSVGPVPRLHAKTKTAPDSSPYYGAETAYKVTVVYVVAAIEEKKPPVLESWLQARIPKEGGRLHVDEFQGRAWS